MYYKTVDITNNDNFAVNFLYKTIPGRLLLRLLVGKTLSRVTGHLMDSAVSRWFIPAFIKRNNIDMQRYKKTSYLTFNQFFVRKLKPECFYFCYDPQILAAPCDGKLTAYHLTDNNIFHIKHTVYSLRALLKDRELAEEFTGGFCLIFRLTPDDYHRYHFIDEGTILHSKRIKGKLHTVKPISLDYYPVFTQNTREYTIMQTKHYGKVVQMEVGAMCVGKICNKKKTGTFKRGEEKGMFAFGGSTVIMLFQRGSVVLDEAIFTNTEKGKETLVTVGCRIGERSG